MKKVLFFTFLFLLSCSDLQKETQQAKIKELQGELSAYQIKFQNEFIDTLFDMKTNTSDLEQSIKKHYHSDTIDLAMGRKIDGYKRMRRMLDALSRTGIMLKHSFEEENEQLKVLLSDVTNGYGQRDQYDNYIKLERTKNEQIFVLLNEYQGLKKESFGIYDSLHVDLSLFVNQLIEAQ